jgi:hypothetical protein
LEKQARGFSRRRAPSIVLGARYHHRKQNLTDKPALYIEMRIFDKGKRASEAMGE